MDIICPDCDAEYDVDESPESCPECGFGPDSCNHPVGWREEEFRYDVGEGTEVLRTYCGKCGTDVRAM